MSNVFDQDSKYNRFMTKIFDLAVLNILWTLTSLPLITIGASQIALYTVTLKMVRNEEGKIISGYFKAFKENLKQSLIPTVLLWLCMGVLFLDFHILKIQSSGTSSFFYGICIVIMFFVITVFSYAFPLFAKFDNTIKNTFSNAWKIAATHLKETSVLVSMNCIPFLWFIVSPGTFAWVFWIWFLLGTALVSYLDSVLLVKIFDEFIEKKDTDEDAC